jgi:uncharacterized protein (TIGR02266 family)
MSHPDSTTTDALVDEFVHLNRRRVFGAPPLAVPELERWQTLRETLEQRLGDRLQCLLATVERRAHFRFATHLEVRFETGDELRTACLGNISEGGIFVATERPLPAGTALHLWISAPEGAVKMAGRVAWARPASSPNGPAGMGVRFEDLSLEQRERIADVVSRYEPSSGRA